MTALVVDESIALQSLGANNNVPLSSINSANTHEHAIIANKTVMASSHPQSRENTTLLKGAGPATDDVGKLAKMATSKITIGVMFTFAVLFMICGITVGLLWLGIYHSILLRELILTPSSTSYGMWKEIPIPMYLELYLYNWTNPEEFVISSTVKPNFVETGPYVFREQHIKVQQTWNDNGTITFQQKRIWHFEESLSNGTLDDEITNLNVIAVTFGHMVKDDNWFVRAAVNRLLRAFDETISVTKTARELLFEGYGDELLSFAKRLNLSAIDIPFDKFGWFYERNGSDTYDGVFNMYTGINDVRNLGELAQWNYMDHTDLWHDQCNVVKGTTGELWPPFSDEQTAEVFAPDICTSMTLARVNDTRISGIDGHTFIADASTFDNGSNVPSRACYCNASPCQPSGVLDVGKCKFGAPAYVGLPHFHLADESYTNAITGMDSQNEDYTFSMTLEPNTGIPLNVQAQLQINLLAEPVQSIDMFTNIPRVYFPMLWFKQEAKMTPEFSNQIKMLLLLPNLGHATCIAIGCIGLSLGLAAIYLCLCARKKRGDTQALITSEDTDNAVRTNPVTM